MSSNDVDTRPDFQIFTSLRYDPLLTSLPINTSMWPATDPDERSSPSSEDNSSNGITSPFYMLPYHRDRMLQAATHFGWGSAVNTLRGPKGFTHLLAQLSSSIDPSTHPSPLRIRILISHDGALTIESSPTPAVSESNLYPSRLPPPRSVQADTTARVNTKISPLTGGALDLGEDDSLHGDPPRRESDVYLVVPDTARTTPSPYTKYKTTSREMYSSARTRVGIESLTERKEVLIVSDRRGGEEIMEGSLTAVFFWRGGRWITPTTESGGQMGTTRQWALERGLCGEGVVMVEELKDGEEVWISSGVRGFLWGRVRLEM